MTCVLKAHGHTPQWVKGTKNHLAPEPRAPPITAINSTFTTCVESLGSRILESGSTLVEMLRDLLGHTNVAQTSTHLAQSTAKESRAGYREEGTLR